MYRIGWTPTKVFYAVAGMFWGFTQEIHSAVLGLFILLLIDTVTGFVAAPYRNQVRSSRGLARFAQKIITYTVAIFSAFVAEKLTFPAVAQGAQLAFWVALALDGVELLSIFENLYDITKFPVFKFLTQLSFRKISEKAGIEVKAEDVQSKDH